VGVSQQVAKSLVTRRSLPVAGRAFGQIPGSKNSLPLSTLSKLQRHWCCGIAQPECQPVPVGMILSPPGQTDQSTGYRFERLFEERPVVEIEQPVRVTNAEIRVDPDRLASKAAWWIFDSDNPFVTIGCPHCLSTSMTI